MGPNIFQVNDTDRLLSIENARGDSDTINIILFIAMKTT